VDNKLTGEDTKLGVEIRFKSLDDFHPEKVAEQIPPLRKLVEARRRLSDLMSKLEGNEKLDGLLQNVIASTDSLAKIGEEAGVKKEEDKK
jgi:type VI secretion system protein ImpB